MRADAVELTADSAWHLADILGAGTFPWVLAITPGYSAASERNAFVHKHITRLKHAGVMSAEGVVDPGVARWIRRVCRPTQWHELRVVGIGGALLRGIVARDGSGTVVALRSGRLVTLTEIDIDHPEALVPVVTAGLSGCVPAVFEDFSLPARVGARADEQIRGGASIRDLLDYLGIPPSARPVVVAAFEDRRTYVEIVSGQHRDGHRITTDVGVSVVDTALGRVLVSPSRAHDGEWISTFAPGHPMAIAAAVERLADALPDGRWFPGHTVIRDFDRPSPERREKCQSPL